MATTKTKTKRRTTRRTFGWVRQLPSKRYQASYMGPDLARHVGPHTFDAKIDAEGWLASESRLIGSGEWTPPAARERAKHDRGLTFTDVAEQYMAARDLKPRTATEYRRLLDQHILPAPALGPRPVREITEQSMATFYGKLPKDRPTQRARIYQLTRAILNHAVELKVIRAAPTPIKSAGRVKRAHKVEPATLAELGTITAAMPARYQLMVLLGAWCALRYGEIAELRRGDVVLQYGTATGNGTPEAIAGKLRIRRGVTWPESATRPVVGPPKSEAGIRDVALPPHLLPVVTAHLAEHAQWGPEGLLFPSRKGVQLHPTVTHKPFRRACTAAGRPDLHFHDLRHTGAVLAAQTGATLAELMARLGHSTPAAAMRYQHAAADRDTALAAALSGLVTGTTPAAVIAEQPSENGSATA